MQTALREWDYAKAISIPNNAPPSYRFGCVAITGIAPMPAFRANTPISRLGLTEHNLLTLHSQSMFRPIEFGGFLWIGR